MSGRNGFLLGNNSPFLTKAAAPDRSDANGGRRAFVFEKGEKMGYIKDQKHFLNYLTKAVRESGEQVALLPEAFYLKYIYSAGKADDFAWTIRKEGVRWLAEPDIWQWLSDSRARYRSNNFTLQLTDAFLKIAEEVHGLPGVYSFWSAEDIVLYVGRSLNLGSRLLESYQRFQVYDRPVWSRHIITRSAADAVVLEAFFITTWNPPLNGTDNYNDGLTVTVEPIPEWSELVQCNWVLTEPEGAANDQS